MDCIVEVRMTDPDQPSWISKPVEKVLEINEREKKKKYLEDCLAARKTFTLFVTAVDGVLGREATLFLKQMKKHLKVRWDVSSSMIANFIDTKVSIAILRATHQCLRGSRVSMNITERRIGMDSSSLRIYQASAI